LIHRIQTGVSLFMGVFIFAVTGSKNENVYAFSEMLEKQLIFFRYFQTFSNIFKSA